MANAKQYEILFQLKAQMDSAFGSQFSSVQQKLAQMQKSITAYQSVLGDIKNYQRTQQSLDEVNKKIDQNGVATSKQAKTVESYKQKLEVLAEKLKQAGVDTNDLTNEQNRLQAEMDETRREMQELADKDTEITRLAEAWSSLKVVFDGVAEAASKVTGFIGACIDSAGTLEYTMSAVGGVSGATAEETEQLTALAKEMGATTIYTAQQCAEALKTEALAGWTVEEMMAGLPAVVSLAAASGEDLTEMTGIVSDALNAFGLSGSEAVTEFADVLVQSATSANTTVSLMGESLSYVESTAANLGYTIQDTALALAVMANNSLKGSVSGSALNTSLTRMSGANAVAAAQMEKMGLSMYNVDGSAKDLLTFLNELRAAFADFGADAESAQVAAYKLAGQRGMRGLLSIVNTSQEEWENMVEAIYDYEGAADTISNIRLDNYQGQIYLLESAWEATKNTIGEAFLPVATDAAEVLTGLCNTVNDFAGENENLVVALGGVAGGALAAATALGGIATVVQVIKNIWEALPSLASLGGWTGAIIGLTAAVGGLVAVHSSSELGRLTADLNDLADSTKESKEAFDEEWETIQKAREEASRLYESIQKDIDAQDRQMRACIDNSNVTDRITAKVAELNELLPDLALNYDKVSNSLSEDNGTILGAIDADSVELAKERIKALEPELENYEEALERAKIEYAKASDDHNIDPTNPFTAWNYTEASAGVTAAQSNVDAIKSEIEDLQNYLDEAWEAKKISLGLEDIEMSEVEFAAIENALTSLQEIYDKTYESAYSSIMGQYSLLTEKLPEASKLTLSTVQKNLDTQLKRQQDYQKNLETLLNSGIDVTPILDEISDGSTDAMAIVAQMADNVTSGNGEATQKIVDDWTELKESVSETANNITQHSEEIQSAYQEALDAMTFDTTALNEEAVRVAQAFVDSMEDDSAFANAGDTIIQKIGESIAASTASGTSISCESMFDFSGAAEWITGEGSNIGEWVGQGFENGMESQSQTIFDTGVSMGDQGIQGVAQGAGTHSPSTYTTETGQNIDQGLINGMTAKEAELLAKANSIGEGATTSFGAGMPYSRFYSYGQNAMQGAINGINSKKSALAAALAAAAQAANRAYAEAQDINSPSKLYEYYSEMDVAGGVQGWERNAWELEQAAAETALSGADAYRAGTISGNMESPLTITGSAGASTTTVQVTFAPVIHASNGAPASDIKTQLEACYPDLVELIKQTMDEREASQRRRAY